MNQEPSRASTTFPKGWSKSKYSLFACFAYCQKFGIHTLDLVLRQHQKARVIISSLSVSLSVSLCVSPSSPTLSLSPSLSLSSSLDAVPLSRLFLPLPSPRLCPPPPSPSPSLLSQPSFMSSVCPKTSQPAVIWTQRMTRRVRAGYYCRWATSLYVLSRPCLNLSVRSRGIIVPARDSRDCLSTVSLSLSLSLPPSLSL